MDVPSTDRANDGGEVSSSPSQNEGSNGEKDSVNTDVTSGQRFSAANAIQKQNLASSSMNCSSSASPKNELEGIENTSPRSTCHSEGKSSGASVKSDTVSQGEEDEKADGVKISESLNLSQCFQSRQNKPSVILLGRGNSFSLGRSEVILLHDDRNQNNRSRLKHSVEENNNTFPNNSSTDNKSDNQTCIVDAQSASSTSGASTPQLYPAPPPISQGNQPGKMTNGVHHMPLSVSDVNGEASQLEMLWKKAESIMAAKQSVVQQVLEEFGIGEAGGGGDEEEENVWQAVQDSFRV